ncbi:MAG: response regulator transcription factor [Burkholderiaceae bacterium]|nr:response regulator transcription factor [Burkholderiaceae bacterium]
MSIAPVTALVADDEPLLRESLILALKRAWPELQVVAQARNGREALELFEEHQPQVVFMDVHMPGLNGIEAAKGIARRAQLVFVTAFEQYALAAFDQGAIDYLVKPVEERRLVDTVQRLKQRLEAGQLPAGEALDAVLAQLSGHLQQQGQQQRSEPWLQWIKASVGAALKLIPVDQLIYLRSDEKYTLVVWPEGEALIRTPIRELADQLDPQIFAQVHRSVIVNLREVSHITRGANETADIHLRGRSEVLPVSRAYLHLFRQM